MRYFIPINKNLFEKTKKEQHQFCFVEVDDTPVSRFARYLQDYLFQESGIYLSDQEIKKYEKSCLASKKNCFDYYPSKQVALTSPKKIHPVVSFLHQLFHTQGVRVTLIHKIDDEKNEPVILPALKQKIDSLRHRCEIKVSFHLNNSIFLTRDNQVFFTRSIIAQKTDGLMIQPIKDWANVVIIENTNTGGKTAYIYDSQEGLNDAVFMYGLNHHKIICSGLIKSTTHKVNDGITIPQILFCPHACATTEKENMFNHNFLLYAMSLHAPINLGFVKNPSLLNPKTAYVYGGFSNEAERQKANEKYEVVLEAIREKQRDEMSEKKEAQSISA